MEKGRERNDVLCFCLECPSETACPRPWALLCHRPRIGTGRQLSFLPRDPVLLADTLQALPNSVSPGTGPALAQRKCSVHTSRTKEGRRWEKEGKKLSDCRWGRPARAEPAGQLLCCGVASYSRTSLPTPADHPVSPDTLTMSPQASTCSPS